MTQRHVKRHVKHCAFNIVIKVFLKYILIKPFCFCEIIEIIIYMLFPQIDDLKCT